MSFGGTVAKAKATPALPHEEGLAADDHEEGIFHRMLGRVRRATGADAGAYGMVGLDDSEEGG